MRILPCLSLFAAIFSSSTAFGSVRTCVSSTSEGFSISPNYCCDVANNPLYTPSQSSGSNPLFEGKSTGRVLVMGGQDGLSCVGAPACAGDGSVFVQATGGDGVTRMYVDAPGIKPTALDGQTACTGDLSGSPACDSTGRVVFKSLSNTDGSPVLATAAPGSRLYGTLPGLSLNAMSRCAVSSSGDVCVAGQVSGSPPALYVGSATAGLQYAITLTGNNFGGASAISKACVVGVCSDATTGEARFIVSPRDSASGLPTGKRMHKPFTITKELDMTVAADPSSAACALCDSQSISLIDSSNDVSGIDVSGGTAAPATEFAILIRAGDSLDGSTVAKLALSPQSFTSSGELMFWASLADGSNGIFAITVPEPTTLAAVGAALTLLARRRR